MSLWTTQHLQHALPQADIPAGLAVEHIGIDSRNLAPSSLFVALQGERDGHDFVANAAKNGAVAALVSHKVDVNIPQIVVPDTLQTLRDLATARRKVMHGKVIAITGSVGKTTTKTLMAAALRATGQQVHAAEASFNNHIGVPLTLANMPADTDYAVIEMGMNAPGEIAPLSTLAQPHVAIVNTVAPSHIGAFSDGLTGIAREKFSITQGLVENGVLVTSQNLHDKWSEFINAPTQLFNITQQAQNVLHRVDGSAFTALVDGNAHDVQLQLVGDHMVHNALCVLTACAAIGADITACATGLANAAPPAGRGQVTKVGDITVVDESYNANPASMAATLERTLELTTESVVAILGDMLELGDNAAQYHMDLAPLATRCAQVHAIGPLTTQMQQTLPTEQRGQAVPTAAELDYTALVDKLPHPCTIVVKGSNGTTYKAQVVKHLLHELNSR